MLSGNDIEHFLDLDLWLRNALRSLMSKVKGNYFLTIIFSENLCPKPLRIEIT